MELSVYSQSGKKATKGVEVPDTIFGARVNESLLAQYVYTYLSNQRASIADTKDRGEVSGGGKKPWKQKGTGRARVGSIRSPIWVKGGVTFGPLSTRNWKKLMPKKMKVAAMRSAFSKLNQAEAIKIVDEIKFDDKSMTKQAAQVLTDMKLDKKTLIVTKAKDAKVLKAFANLPKTQVVQIGELNAYDLLTNNNVLICQDALDYLQHWA
jgi:large subunit ribosomal protein L4